MTLYCHCTQYNGTYGAVVHPRGKKGKHGNCLHYVDPALGMPEVVKDALMRTHVRESFARVSTAMVGMADQGRVTRRVGLRAHGPSAVHYVSCEHPDAAVLVRQRDLFLRFLEELLEREDIPGVDQRWYHNQIRRAMNDRQDPEVRKEDA